MVPYPYNTMLFTAKKNEQSNGGNLTAYYQVVED